MWSIMGKIVLWTPPQTKVCFLLIPEHIFGAKHIVTRLIKQGSTIICSFATVIHALNTILTRPCPFRIFLVLGNYCHFSDDICFLSECRYWEWTNIGATNDIKNKSHVRCLLQFLGQNFGHGIVSIWGFNFSKWLYLSGNPKIGKKTTSNEMYRATKRRNQKCQRCGKLYCYCRSIKMIGIQSYSWYLKLTLAEFF